MPTSIPAPKPTMLSFIDNYTANKVPRLHWYDRPGGGWTLPGSMARLINEHTIHWSEVRTPPDRSDRWYLDMIGKEAYYHALQRDWEPVVPGIQGGDGIMYHYMIAPNGTIFYVTAETHRTWNAYEANASNIATCMLAGHGDRAQQPAIMALRALMTWMAWGRSDLPLITPTARTVVILGQDGHATNYKSAGTLTHDESLIRHGRPPKGCCGIYAATVEQWRQEQPNYPSSS